MATEQEITQAYQSVLGRAPDAAGLAYWSNPTSNFSLDAFKSGAAQELASRPAASGVANTWPKTTQATLTADIANDLIARSSITGVPTSEFNKYGGYDAVYAMANNWKGSPTVNDIIKYGSKARDTGNLSYISSGGALPTTGYDGVAGNNYFGEAQSALDLDQKNGLLTLPEVNWKKPVAPVSTAQYPANFNSQVDAPTETIEGRIQNLLAANNPVIRQAGDRAIQAFADRGLLNSSMAQQASYEAMVAKAIEIAGPDAQKYFDNRTNNVNWQNKFATNEQLFGYDMQKLEKANSFATEQANNNASLAMQSNYQSAIANVDQLYKQQMQQLQTSQMEPADKQAAIDGLTTVRDNSIRLMTATFQQFPGWSTEWSKLVAMLPTA